MPALPFYNLMNNTDEFVQLMDKPVKKSRSPFRLALAAAHFAHDLWYLGGGAYDNKVFGFTGRPANGFLSWHRLPT